MLLNIILGILLLGQMNGVYLIENDPFLTVTNNAAQAVVPQRINEENLGVKVTADKYFVLDVNSGKVLAEHNSNIQQPIASITKIMTALVILDLEPNWQSTVTYLEADETVGAFPHIYRGEQVRFIDSWKSALISSDNNSIMAMVRSLGLSRAEFVELMNEKADELGLYSTNFADPTGLSEENISTATDVAKMIYQALRKNEIREAVIQPEYVFNILNSKKERKIYSTDILLDSFLNSAEYGYELIGGKTGYLQEAGYCLAVEIEHDDVPVLIVVLNSDKIEDRFQDTKVLADWVFTNYQWGSK